MNLVRHPCSDGFQLGCSRSHIQVAQIGNFDFIRGSGRKDLLETLGQNDCSKHLVAINYFLQSGLEAFPIPIFHIHFGVAVTGNISQFNPL